ncbi:unnamed protein product [Psylliodes chrysocephalus]|uniref:SWIM-type domain-containing protein n=1 Tax=Psylliodes chrysocephalus TaxID=3402493 RepID=A0A9P0D4P9_9CUCU|nr:unnamed protein product [Psylliodes chrysocephala]
MVGVKNISEMMLKQGEIHVHHGNESGKTRTGKNSRRIPKNTLDYQKFFERSKNITEVTQVDEKTFKVQSERTLEYYVVGHVIGFCTCLSGSGGHFCKHLLEVENKYCIMFQSALLLSEKDRQQLTYLALGKEIPLSSFEDINSPVHEGSSNEHTSDQTTSQQAELGAPSQFNIPIDQIGEHPAAMQHGGQLRLEYPLSAVLLSILVAVAAP